MLLKLSMPSYHRLPEGGYILKWHKAEGDWVDYGDDLFDIRAERALIMRSDADGWCREQVERLVSPRVQMALKKIEQGEFPAAPPNPEEFYRIVPSAIVLRVSAADRGRLRKIHAVEGERCQGGESLAILSTEADEPIGDTSAGEQASEFRLNDPTAVAPEDLW